MNDTLIDVYMVVSIIVSLAGILYVLIDVALEIVLKRKKDSVVLVSVDESIQETNDVSDPKPELVLEPEIEIIESDLVEIPEDLAEPESVDFGIEVIGVAWPESMAKNKIYKYDPNGEVLNRGDVVLVPTFDSHRGVEVLRTATVINGNYYIESTPLGKELKKIVRVVK